MLLACPAFHQLYCIMSLAMWQYRKAVVALRLAGCQSTAGGAWAWHAMLAGAIGLSSALQQPVCMRCPQKCLLCCCDIIRRWSCTCQHAHLLKPHFLVGRCQFSNVANISDGTTGDNTSSCENQAQIRIHPFSFAVLCCWNVPCCLELGFTTAFRVSRFPIGRALLPGSSCASVSPRSPD
jgi:hypothetical protein